MRERSFGQWLTALEDQYPYKLVASNELVPEQLSELMLVEAFTQRFGEHQFELRPGSNQPPPAWLSGGPPAGVIQMEDLPWKSSAGTGAAFLIAGGFTHFWIDGNFGWLAVILTVLGAYGIVPGAWKFFRRPDPVELAATVRRITVNVGWSTNETTGNLDALFMGACVVLSTTEFSFAPELINGLSVGDEIVLTVRGGKSFARSVRGLQARSSWDQDVFDGSPVLSTRRGISPTALQLSVVEP
jgi:hypothetical protein